MYFWVFLYGRKFKLENDLNSKYCTLELNAASYTLYWSDFHTFYLIE